MMLTKLRDATQELHREIEKDNLAGLIMTHEINLEEYKLLLLQNYIAYAITEPSIAKYLDHYEIHKTPQLLLDLEHLGISGNLPSRSRESFRIINRAEAFGAAYVVEGSVLGGMMISKELKHCSALQGIKVHHFFNGKRDNVKSWNNFGKILKQQDFTALEEIQAIDKAKGTFLFFGEIFKSTRIAS